MHPPTAANIANYQNSHNIAGIATPNASTIQFTLMAPASDFLYMLAMPVPRLRGRKLEYDSHVPNSLQLDQHTVFSDGPYQISSYVPGEVDPAGPQPGVEAVHRRTAASTT